MNVSSHALDQQAAPVKGGGTLARLATGAVLIPVVVAGVWWGNNTLVAAATALVTLVALWEFFSLGEKAGLKGYRWWTALSAAGILFQQWAVGDAQTWVVGRLRVTRFLFTPDLPLEWVLFAFALGLALILVLTRRPATESLGGVSISAAALLFIVLPLSTVIRMDAVSFGRRLLLFTLALVWAGDTLGYFVGRSIGRTAFAPEISPKKTWEGAIANLAGSLGVALLMASWLHLTMSQALTLAALGNVAGQIGDLLESGYKRSAGVKDSGALLPGHGGMLDRIDALILAAPMVWYYFHMVIAPQAGF